MHWKMKAHGLAILSRLPAGIGMYHRLQKAVGTNRLMFDESVRRCAEVVRMLREAGVPENGTAVEIGTGWRPFLPFVLYLSGFDRIVTFDINPWMDRSYACETAAALKANVGQLDQMLGISKGTAEQRFPAIDLSSAELSAVLSAFRVEYKCGGDAGSTALGEASVDCVVSTNVLEHVDVVSLKRIHRESYRILKPSGAVAHRINPQDHFVSVDSQISGVNFLQFSERQWYWYGGSGLSYHNRLRCVQHQRFIEEAGFEVVSAQIRSDERAEAAIRSGKVSVHPDFRHFTVEELAADHICLAGVKREAGVQQIDKVVADSTRGGSEPG